MLAMVNDIRCRKINRNKQTKRLMGLEHQTKLDNFHDTKDFEPTAVISFASETIPREWMDLGNFATHKSALRERALCLH